MTGINDLANSIATFEGWGTPGSIASRNNNPGNLRYASNQVGSENTVNGKFATFATAEDGWLALQEYISNKMAQGVTLREFIYTYAPPSENNTSGYLSYLVGKLGIGADSSLSELGSYAGDSNGDSGSGDSVLSNLESGTGLSVEIMLGATAIVLLLTMGER